MQSRFPSWTVALRPQFTRGDVVVFAVLVAGISIAVHLSGLAPRVISGPEVSLSYQSLPVYAALSSGRMLASYVLSLGVMFFYGNAVAYSKRARWILLPLLDILQSVPLLSFLPFVLLALTAMLPHRWAVELASVILLFTCQAWNLIYAWYQSISTIPHELEEAATIFRFNRWLRFKNLELPSATISLVWNSMISWANGWFFLMAAEIFTVGDRDFRLPGLGAYLREAASSGNVRALTGGLILLVCIIVAMDQLLWRPILAAASRRRSARGPEESAFSSWFLDALIESRLMTWVRERLVTPTVEKIDALAMEEQENPRLLRLPRALRVLRRGPISQNSLLVFRGVLILLLVYGLWRGAILVAEVHLTDWKRIFIGTVASQLRVTAALLLALLWTVPVGVAIGTNRTLARWLQPIVQILASIPATALLPAFLLVLADLPAGVDMAAILLMVMGTQWYLLFNIIAGASAIPQDLLYTADLMNLTRWERWKTLILPAIFPHLVTGAVITTGGAWNASIVAEYVEFGGKTLSTLGLGSLIAEATGKGKYSLLLTSTLCMVLTVVLANRFVWQRLYQLSSERFRLD